jgi:hypothetical protein
MSEKKGSPLAAAICGFVLGAIAMKLAQRFCPLCGCCGGGRGAACCCCGGDGEGCCCEDDGEEHEPEAEAEPAA